MVDAGVVSLNYQVTATRVGQATELLDSLHDDVHLQALNAQGLVFGAHVLSAVVEALRVVVRISPGKLRSRIPRLGS